MGKHYEIKVSIRDTHPPTWRRIKVPAKMTFNELAAVLELAFEWLGGHLYQFEVGNPYLSSKEGVIIGVPCNNDILISRVKNVDSKKVKLEDYFDEYKRIRFIYDFGDDWVHDIVVEKVIDEDIKEPKCIKAKGGAYPEDFGGLYGCEQMGIGGGDAPYLGEINEEIECYKEFAKQIYSK